MARLLRHDEVAKMLGLGSSRAFIRWLDNHPEFPKPVSIGKTKNKPMKRWLKSEVNKWIFQLKE